MTENNQLPLPCFTDATAPLVAHLPLPVDPIAAEIAQVMESLAADTPEPDQATLSTPTGSRGRPPGNRAKRTVYVDQDAIETIERRHLEMQALLGRFPLANILDAVLIYADEHWEAVAATVVIRDDRKKQR